MSKNRLILLVAIVFAVTSTSGTVQAGGLSVGDLVITEFFANPSGNDGEESEFFEIYNTTANPIDLNGLTFTEDDGDNEAFTVITSVLVGPGDFAVWRPRLPLPSASPSMSTGRIRLSLRSLIRLGFSRSATAAMKSKSSMVPRRSSVWSTPTVTRLAVAFRKSSAISLWASAELQQAQVTMSTRQTRCQLVP